MSASFKPSVPTGRCPRCYSDNIVYDKEFVDDDLLTFPGRCLDCECQFNERYFLYDLDTEYIDTEDNEESNTTKE